MKIKEKQKEPTAMEKRNSSIAAFAGFAAIPLLLTLFLGFSLGNTEKANHDKLLTKLDSISEENSLIKSSANGIKKSFQNVDSLIVEFKEYMTKVKEELKDTSSEGLEAEDEIRIWERKWKKKTQDYKLDLDDMSSTKFEYPSIATSHKAGIKWANEFIAMQEDELFALKVKKKLNVGIEINEDLDKKLEDLEDELVKKDVDIKILTDKLESTEGSSKVEKSHVAKDYSEMQNKYTELENKYKELIQNNNATKQALDEALNKIRKNILPDLKGTMIGGNKDKINKLKELLQADIISLEKSISELKIKD